MGENPGDPFACSAERPAHEVSIPPGLAFSIAPVTVREYRRFQPAFAPEDESEWPAVMLSWVDAEEYCAWLSLQTGFPYRLPTESEWEFGCRAGSARAYTLGDEMTPLLANYLREEDGTRVGQGCRTPAGTYPPNVFGLLDVHGNVFEWVTDSWHPDYFGAPAEGSSWRGPGDLRVVRGGSWICSPRMLRSSYRDCLPRAESRNDVGFRLAVSLEVPE